jgi:hypothetical protein
MAKHSIRGYYALGALVLGIILLYIVIRNVEPFEDNKKSIYLYMPATGNATVVDAAGLTVTPSTNKIVISYGSNKYTLANYDVHAYGRNCTDQKAKDKNGNCWYKVTVPGNPVTVSNYEGTAAIGAKSNAGLLTIKQKAEKGLTVTQFSRANCSNPETSTDKLPNKANIRIDLTLQ